MFVTARHLVVLATIALVAGFAAPARAHHAGFSTLRVQVEPAAVRATLTIDAEDIWGAPPGPRNAEVLAAVARDVQRLGAELIELRADEIVIDPASVAARADAAKAVIVELSYPLTERPMALKVWSRNLSRLPLGHKQVVTVQDVPTTPGKPGPLLGQFELGGGAELVFVELPARDDLQIASPTRPATRATTAPVTRPASAEPPAVPPREVSWFRFGVEHIVGDGHEWLLGADHLLFLAALLLVVQRFGQAVRIITLFTIAHSITLALAVFDLVRLDASIVEPAIAASILYVAAENLWLVARRSAQARQAAMLGAAGDERIVLLPGRALGWRSAVTFAFGLIHGLGFASLLQDQGIGELPGGVAMPLLMFNLGVEAGQLGVAALVLPVLLLLQRRLPPAWARGVVVVGSATVAILGGWWLLERTVLT